MFRSLIAAVVLVAVSGAAASAAQIITVVSTDEGDRIDHAARYDAAEPVTVRVQADGDTATLVGSSPAGGNLQVPLVRADGWFTGNVRLDPGTWTLAVQMRQGSVATTGSAFTVEAGDADGSAIATLAGLALLSTAGGAGLIAVGRRGQTPETA